MDTDGDQIIDEYQLLITAGLRLLISMSLDSDLQKKKVISMRHLRLLSSQEGLQALPNWQAVEGL